MQVLLVRLFLAFLRTRFLMLWMKTVVDVIAAQVSVIWASAVAVSCVCFYSGFVRLRFEPQT